MASGGNLVGKVRRKLDFREEPMRRLVMRGKLVHPYWKRRFHSLGKGSIVYHPNWVYGPHQIAVGNGVLMMRGIWLSIEKPAWDLPAPVLQIGNLVGFRPYVTISVAESVIIEDHVNIGSFTTIIDSDHVHNEEHPNIVYAGSLASSPIRIGEGCWIGERVAILRGSNIGKQCTIGTNSVVRGNIPDYSVAVGAPARVVGSTRS
jgi:UDP-3-O-[3-hydroxymyristoyl] glucosamine N-acyltransferase